MNKFDEVYNKIIIEMNRKTSKKHVIKEDEDLVDLNSLTQDDLVPIFKHYLPSEDLAKKIIPDFYDELADVFMNEWCGYERLVQEKGEQCSRHELNQFIEKEINEAIKETFDPNFNEEESTSFEKDLRKYLNLYGKILIYLH